MFSKKDVCRFVDLTTLNTYDSTKSVDAFLKRALTLEKKGFQVAAVCLFPNFATQSVKKLSASKIKIAVVAGNFPNSQSFLSVKLHECELALESGVDELDIVLNIGAFMDEDYQQVIDEVRAVKNLMGHKTLKVILETGLLKNEKLIKKAAELAIEGGADFIKTSTGKDFPGADIKAVEIMSSVILQHYKKTRNYTGLKISGGVKTYEHAIEYINCVENILGVDFIKPELFRIGASSLLNNLTNE
ncbi:MAG: deoxyribose-phosphate aldolase [Brumimicrobium sp.]